MMIIFTDVDSLQINYLDFSVLRFVVACLKFEQSGLLEVST